MSDNPEKQQEHELNTECMENEHSACENSEPESDASTDSSQDEAFTTPPVSYNLKLFCSTDQTKSRNTKIVIPHTPRTVLDVKLCVEKDLSIPACCQCVIFESHELRDQDSIKQQRIREGDTLVIKYTSDAMVEDVREIIQEMKAMRRFLQRKDIRKCLASGCDPNSQISTNVNEIKVKILVSVYFKHANSDETNKANRLFFIRNNGLQITHRLHKELLRHPWNNCVAEMQRLEYAIMRLLWNISAAISIRELLLQRPTLEAVMKSFLRVKVPADQYLNTLRQESYETTIYLLFAAVAVIGNLSEIPECRVVIASRKDVLDQLLAILTCPSLTSVVSLVASTCLVCLSYSAETHLNLATDEAIQVFDCACKTEKANTSFKDKQLLKYSQTVFYCQLLYSSASKIPLHLKFIMYEAIRNFLATASHSQIHSYERERDYYWATATPSVKLAYFPKCNPHWSFCGPDRADDDTTFLRELEEMCIEMGVFSLQSMLLSDKTRDILAAESLVDYITCLPWHLPPDTKAHRRACELRVSLSQKMQLQPPSLVNLTKAKLAATHCGLEKVLKANSLHEIVDNITD